ncbi:hypothetical protein AVEN_133959-1 [Araneus ventricosus]|uniref:Uncharacterized protein n=1 Tax=Araneus ventricosus TaxID=182803 RepID=A0A4Y2VHR3_ARAVE|nr:hypothetical protein AVEN_262558-1 [Araneus ventricosus]GBO24161.1 hypothetical protein AVEN_133959-1 [Araneus ventricosus]
MAKLTVHIIENLRTSCDISKIISSSFNSCYDLVVKCELRNQKIQISRPNSSDDLPCVGPSKSNVDENCGLEDSPLQLAKDNADVHIVKTAIQTYEKIKKQAVVIGQNVDVLALLNALTPDYMDILMLKEGKGKIKDRFYSSKDLRNSNLVIECKKSILFLHAISGCDTTSVFYGKGKLLLRLSFISFLTLNV